jgi:ABC-2 type transport system ATP-binding protein
MSSEIVLKIDSVIKAYGKDRAVDRVSFSVPKGGIFGLLGPNGAGKTSTIRMITGITRPDSGTIQLFGEAQNEQHQNLVGYMPEERGLYRKLPVRAQLEYLAELKGLSRAAAMNATDYWLGKFEIGTWEKKKTSELSKGMQQKVQFIATVLHDPQLLILDEPLSGLDPINAELINNTITELKHAGKTIILSTHRMEQVEQVCDEIVLLNRGRVVLAGPLREIKQKSGRQLVAIRFDGSDSFLDGLTNCKIIERHPNEAMLELTDKTQYRPMLRAISDQVELLKWELIEPPLKELFLEAVAKQSTTA